MKTTNKSKMMIAFLTVAALALVSMAGVALAKNVDADPAPVDSYVNGMLTVSANTADTFGVWAEYGKTTTVTFKDDAKYSKTMYFGKYTPAAPANVAAGTPAVLESLEAYVIIEFKDMKGVTLTYGHNSDTVTITNDNLGATDIKVTKGAVCVPNSLENFNGKIAGNTATLAVVNAIDFTLTAGETDVISGYPEPGNVVGSDPTTEYSITLGSKAIVNYYFGIFYGLKFVVAEGAEMTIAPTGDVYEIPSGTVFTMDIGDAAAGNYQGATARIYMDELPVTKRGTFAENKLSFITTEEIYASSTAVYKLMVAYYDGTDPYVYAGDLTFSVTFNASGDINGLKANLLDSETFSKFNKADFGVTGPNVLTFDKDRYVCLSAAAVSTSGSAKVGNYWDTSGTITFTPSPANNDKVLVTFFDKLYGRYAAYQGTATVLGNSLTLGDCVNTKILSVGADAAAGTIGTKCTIANSYTTIVAYDYNATFEVDGGTVNVDGKIDVKYSNSYTYGVINNSNIINVAGEIVYETDTSTAPLDCGALYKINAAHYNVAPAAVPALQIHTHHYTTLTKAMAAAKNVDIYGEMVILDDTTLTGTPVGTAASKNAFTVKAYSVLVVGQVDNPATDGVVEETKAAIVTLPATSSITMGGSPDGGYVKVEKGQFKIAPNETAPRGYDKIEAAVFMKTTGFDVYTDLVTALNISVSGDVVKVRSATATIDENAEVKEGVTLQAENATSTPVDITVNPGKVFTVSGTVKDIHSITVETDATNGNGQLILKSVKFKLTGDYAGIYLAGTLEFASSFDNTTTAAFADFKPVQIVFNGEESIVKVVGKVLFRGFELNDTSTATLVDVTGKADFQVPFDSNIVVNMNIAGGTVNKGEDANFNITKLTATGAAKITLDTDVTPFVILEKAVIGTKSDAFTDNVNPAEMKLYLSGEGTYATVYGKFDATKMSVFTISNNNVEESFKTVFYLVSVNGNNTYVYQTVYAAVDDYSMVMPFPEVVGHNFLGWYANVQFSGNAFDSAKCGEHANLYGKFALKTYVLTFEYQEGVKWLLDGVVVEGQKTTTYGNHNVKVAAAAGFDISKVTLKKGGAAYIAGESFPVAGDIVFSASEAAEKPAKADSFGLIETLLIIITVMVVIMAIIIALKLMRS